MNIISKKEIVKTWNEVFSNSSMSVRNSCFNDGLSCSGRLAKDITECSNGILENDPLNYGFIIYENNYEECRTFIRIKPNNSNMCYSSIWLRKKNSIPRGSRRG